MGDVQKDGCDRTAEYVKLIQVVFEYSLSGFTDVCVCVLSTTQRTRDMGQLSSLQEPAQLQQVRTQSTEVPKLRQTKTLNCTTDQHVMG